MFFDYGTEPPRWFGSISVRFRPSTKISFWFTFRPLASIESQMHLDALAQVALLEAVAYPSLL